MAMESGAAQISKNFENYAHARAFLDLDLKIKSSRAFCDHGQPNCACNKKLKWMPCAHAHFESRSVHVFDARAIEYIERIVFLFHVHSKIARIRICGI